MNANANESATPDTITSRRLWILVCALGVTQIISWGQLYYSIAVLWPAISTELQMSRTLIFTVVSLTLLINGLVAPFAGRRIDLHGGRSVMSLGSVVAAVAFAVLSIAHSQPIYLVGWALGGLAMSMTMYDPAFATLSQHAGERYRRTMTAVTLFGGLASTLFWPLTAGLQDAFGWRGVFIVFVGLQLLICLPLHWFVIPTRQARQARSPSPVGSGSPIQQPDSVKTVAPKIATQSTALPMANASQMHTYRWLTTAFCLHAFVMSVIAVHLLALLQDRGLTLAQAVTVGMFIGPAQVLGRLVDMLVGSRFGASHTGSISLALITIAMCLLIIPNMTMSLGLVIAVFWGSGTGLVTIAKGICIDEVFGRDDYGFWMGRVGRWLFSTHAIAPAGFALMLSSGLAYKDAGWLFAVLTILAFISFRIAFRQPKQSTQAG